MSMTKKDFEAIAEILNNVDYSNPEHSRLFIVEKLADYFSTVNDKFDRERFLKACGVSQ